MTSPPSGSPPEFLPRPGSRLRGLTPPARRLTPLALLLLGMLLLAGCDNDQVRQYRVPREAPPEPVRLLAAIVPHGKEMWFFKLLGPAGAVGEHRESFVEFVRSVRFTGDADDPIQWQAPGGWQKQPVSGMRYAAFLLGRNGRPPELTVFRFDKSPVLDNVNRWRNLDLGLKPISEKELGEVTQKLEVGDLEVTMVDMTGPGARKGRPMGAPHPPVMGRGEDATWTAPKGWQKLPLQQFQKAHFQAGEGERAARAFVTQMPARFASLTANINRWRDKVGLPEVDDEEAAKQPVKELRVGGSPAKYFDIKGPKLRTLVVMVVRDQASWFFRMEGPSAAVAAQKNAFEEFVRSVKFSGGRGASDE
jgi:hypothetical protein